jgi:hypothetical protein
MFDLLIDQTNKILYNKTTMDTRADIISKINNNVTVMADTSIGAVNVVDTLQLDNGNTLETQEIPVAITDDTGALVKRTQLIYVEYSGTGESKTEVQAFIGKKQVNHVPSTAESDLLTKFQDIETTVGGEVKVNPESLNTLGIAYLVFEAGGTKKVTATLNGTSITRDAI